MTRSTDFARLLSMFLREHLPRQKNASSNTIHSYRDTFKLLLKYCSDQLDVAAEMLTIELLTADVIAGFLDWVEAVRGNSVSTRNLRLAAIHAFFRYVQYEAPECIQDCQRILAIPSKKGRKKTVNFLTPAQIGLLLEQPDRSTQRGLRDLALLSLLYDSGARVQELVDLNVCDFVPGPEAILVLTGKGNKVRRVPVLKNTARILERYIAEEKLDQPHMQTHPLFTNRQKSRLTKEGVTYVLRKYARMARAQSKEIPSHVHCHMLRHSKAMHLLQAGVNLIYIRDFLGHANAATTEVYAKADTELKRKAIAAAAPAVVNDDLPEWNKDQGLMDWLTSL